MHQNHLDEVLVWINLDCQRFRLTGQDHLTVHQVYGQDRIRRLRCRTCGEECSKLHGTTLCTTKIAEEQAASVINHLGEVCGVRATTRLVHVAKDPIARLLWMAGRHAERCHDQCVRNVNPRALEFDEQ
jgi:transposase-like protein